jgi:D-glycero-alpha-D-manno-heptose 1-phosphate guanylyltransferase
VPTAVILAGGMGTRLRSTVPDLPKPMAPINGRPFLEHQMDYWIGQGVDRFVISVGYKRQVIMDYFGQSYRAVPLVYAIEEEPLGTGGGLLAASRGLSEPYLVLNGDTFFEVRFVELLKFHNERSSDWTFALFSAPEVGRYMGIDLNDDGEIASLKSATIKPGRLANGGVYLVNPSTVKKTKFAPGHKLSLENDLLPELVAEGSKLYGIEFSGRFIDIGVPDDYFRAMRILSD